MVQVVHERLREKIEDHKERHDPEPLELTARDVGVILQTCGVPPEKVSQFEQKCDEQFGSSAALSPTNLIDTKRFELKTPEITISVRPEYSYLVESRVINGKKYLLSPVDETVEINGMPVEVS